MTTLENIDYQNIALSKQKTKSKSKFLYVYLDKKPLLLKLPKMELAYGLSKNTFYESKVQYNFDLSFKNNDALVESFEKLDDFIIEKVKEEHYPELSIEEVKKLYTSCVKYSNPQFPPVLKSKIITQESKIKCDMFYSEPDEEGKLPRINIEEAGGESFALALLPRQKKVEVILECIGLWFMNGKFGLSFKALQVKVYPIEKTVNKCEFIDSDTSDSEVDFLGE
jgi:hypothetical protein